MALLRDIGHSLEYFRVLNKQTNDPKPKNQNGYQNKGNNNITGEGQRGKKRSQGQISTDRKDPAVELKGIPEDIIAEHKKADMCLKCGKGLHKWFKRYTKNPIVSTSAKTTFGRSGFRRCCRFHVDSALRNRSTRGFYGFCTTQSIRWGIPWILYSAINGTPDSGLPTSTL